MMLNPTIKLILTSIIAIVCFTKGSCQTETDSIITKNYNSNEVLKGSIFDANDKSSLPYANIILLSKNKGVISNEVGHFSINISNCLETDTLRISYIGYQTQDLTIKDLKDSSVIHLKEDNLMLNNITLFGNVLDPESIVKKVLENKNNNYGETNSKKQIFLRNRYTNHMNELNFRCKKSNFSNLDKELIEVLEQEIPKHTISYRDFLGDVYLLQEEDSAALKINPIKIIELEEKSDLTKLGELEKTFKEDIKKRIDETSKYIRPSEKTTDYAYMFIPADGLYQDLLNSRVGTLKINSKDLVSYAYTKKVMIVSPMSLFPMLQITVKALHNMKVERSIAVSYTHLTLPTILLV